MKMVSSPGVISSFFTYDNESWAGGIPWREIDIESVGKRADLLQTNLITGEANHRIHSEQLHTVDEIDEFHEHTLIWTPDEITWQVDGVTIHQELASQSLQVQDMRDTPQSYRMNLWVADSIDWAGRFNIDNLHWSKLSIGLSTTPMTMGNLPLNGAMTLLTSIVTAGVKEIGALLKTSRPLGQTTQSL